MSLTFRVIDGSDDRPRSLDHGAGNLVAEISAIGYFFETLCYIKKWAMETFFEVLHSPFLLLLRLFSQFQRFMQCSQARYNMIWLDRRRSNIRFLRFT